MVHVPVAVTELPAFTASQDGNVTSEPIDAMVTVEPPDHPLLGSQNSHRLLSIGR